MLGGVLDCSLFLHKLTLITASNTREIVKVNSFTGGISKKCARYASEIVKIKMNSKCFIDITQGG